MPTRSTRTRILFLCLLILLSAGSMVSSAPGGAARSVAPRAVAPIQGAPEPSGPLNAGARLVRLTGSGRELRAVIEMKVLSLLSGADVEVFESSDLPGTRP